MREVNCERCGEPMNPSWCLDDQMDRDICESCQEYEDNLEAEKDLRDHS